MSSQHRYEDHTRPTVGEAATDLLTRAILPSIPWWLVMVGIGWLLVHPFASFDATETGINTWLQAHRTPLLDDVTHFFSMIGNTEYVIAICLAFVALVWWRTKEWWFAIIPGIAISLQATLFVLCTLVIGRPRPHVEHLDPAPPTSSYPSGHVGASTAVYVSFLLMSYRIENAALRTLVRVLCVLLPLLVLFARLYRGMHHPTDVVVGLVNGIVCALLAWHYLRRDASQAVAPRG